MARDFTGWWVYVAGDLIGAVIAVVIIILVRGLKTVSELWDETRDGWKDAIARDFESRYWVPLEAQSLAAAQAMDAARVSLAGEIVYQARRPMVRIGRAAVALPPGAFMQATPQGEAAMAGFASEALGGAEQVADLFSGVGTFALRLAETARVHAADSSAEAITALLEAQGSTAGLKAVTAEARDLFRRPVLAQELKKFDAAIFDPPRAGAEAQAGEIARSGLTRVVGVSCNPATFARDARILTDAGFRLEQVLPVDQFLWSPHVELVGAFSR